MIMPKVAEKKSLGKTIGLILVWLVVILVAMGVLGYNIPNIAHWGFTGTLQIMEARLQRLTLPADRLADLHRYLNALKQYVETTRLEPDRIVVYVNASDALAKVLKSGRADDQDMLAVRQAFADSHIAVGAPEQSPAQGKK